ncbi:hypothetical protein TNCV_4238581 [Trichonephila clavipes]|nr:hypothetical protein TNCV_4238581 [Trichonephila clavipes]
MATPGSSFTPTPLGHEDNLEVRHHPRANTLQLKLKLRGATAHVSQDLLCPSQYIWQLGAEVHEQISRSDGQSERISPVFSPQAYLVLIYEPSEGMKS